MAILTDVVSIILRLAELAFAAIVAGVNGDYLHRYRHARSWDLGRFIYAEVVAGIALFLSLLWLVPFTASFVHWPGDLLVSVTWFVAFGLLVNQLHGSCGYVFDWGDVGFYRRAGQCGEWKAVIAFCFLSAVVWLVSALVGFLWVRDHETRAYRRRTLRRSRV
ncbi:marvel domain-containing protein [Xylariomycetidae sp. FL0641]|nr:marvel domain-containing protein [Xylariomycetidae sp. FL0641]